MKQTALEEVLDTLENDWLSPQPYIDLVRSKLEKERLQINELMSKAERWDALEDKIARFYVNENGDELDDEEGGHLCDIGEVAAAAFGFL